MSERKSAEIKFRCTPSFKSGVQAAADAAEQSLTEYIEAAVWSHQNARLGAENLAHPLVEVFVDKPEYSADGKAACSFSECSGGTTCSPRSAEDIDVDCNQFPTIWDGAGETPVIPNRDDQHPDCACRPWEFCTHKATA